VYQASKPSRKSEINDLPASVGELLKGRESLTTLLQKFFAVTERSVTRSLAMSSVGAPCACGDGCCVANYDLHPKVGVVDE
jgi:hypothetical protein